MTKVVPLFPENGLLPAIIQDSTTGKVLMLGYMNPESFQQTQESGLVTFYSRSKGRLWTKGESSGNFLSVVDILVDCDRDTILIKAKPQGPVCHTGADTCFEESNVVDELNFLSQLQLLLRERRTSMPEGSYVSSLFKRGRHKIAQKLGEEAVETVIEACKDDRELLVQEGADLLFHFMVLLVDSDIGLEDVVRCLMERHHEK